MSPAPRRARRPGSRDGGSAAAELVLVTPLLVLLLLLAVMAGRLVNGQMEVESAAQQAARAASLARTPAAASAQAQAVAQAALAQSVTCDPAVVIPGLGDFVPGGQVTVQVSCTVQLSGLSLLDVPGTQRLTFTATSPIDVYQGESLGLAAPGTPSRQAGEGKDPGA